MLEILDGDQDALEVLVNEARSGTPKDLSHWRFAPRMLLDRILCCSTTLSDAVENSNDPAEEKCNRKWEEGDVIRWICRAVSALHVCPWLDFYSSPVA